MYEYVPEQLMAVMDEVRTVAEKAGRAPDSVKVLAISKTFPVAAVEAAYAGGQRRFGENRIQELENKVSALASYGDIEWHLTGQLQSNKVRKAVQLADYIHTVDSLKLLDRIDGIAGEEGKRPKIFIEVNVSGEASKSGVTVADAPYLVERALQCTNIELQGFMTMAPFDAGENVLTEVFSSLAALRDDMERRFAVKLLELSMGMSGDFKTAIECGATCVRIGTAIFGRRDYA